MGTFVISKRFNDEYKFEYVSRKGKTIVTSDSYELKFECEEAIELLKESLLTCNYLRISRRPYERHVSRSNQRGFHQDKSSR